MTSKSILIYDTTLRDGSQGEGVSFSLQDKLNIAERLAEIGVDFIEGGYPLSNEKDVAFFQEIKKRDLGKTKVCAFGMTRRKRVKAEEDPGMRALVAAQTPCITLVGKTWDYHATEVLNVTLDENLALIGESAEFLGRSAEVIYDAEHFFDGFNANPEYAIKTLQAAASAGAVWLSLCDTNGGTLPDRIAEVTAIAIKELADYNVQFGIHCHNDCELAVANSIAAVDAGATQVQGTINGIGERCGNVDLVSVMANLALKKQGYSVLGGRSLQPLTELSRFVYETANLQWRNSQPFVGQSAFAHKGGMHVHAINKAAKTYEHIDPVLVGNERRILVSELSGRSNIVAVANRYNIKNDRELMDKVLAEVVRLENQGYQFENAGASFDLLVKRLAGTFKPHFETIKYRVVAGDRDSEASAVYAEAIIKLKVGDQLWFDAAEGHGPVNALDAALRKALADDFPQLNQMRLIDYKVRVVDSGAGTAASTRVNIESCDDKESWGTIGVSENIIEASWRALVDAVEYKLHKAEINSGP
ncbi:citramalate synthase [Novipirellula artificiosorum]|uniref:Citramalate synthase n=1 Tax=Novipirellula artificiosorum TaxID=2528016 RepID=A0A5C6DMW6_9BACT|nr:citramalate synthase [Novipirellula artificiosorum]TWU37197.1 2-isopropylmalate synthase [Novipirellula artificiosorum]